MRIKRVLIVLTILCNLTAFAQKAQRIAYIDMNYILESVPDYVEAQKRLDEKVKRWQNKLNKLSNEIEALKTNLSNERALLTKTLIEEREEDIDIKVVEFNRLKNAYFGPKGDLFQLRKQFATPIQDQVFNAVQEIAKRKRYDFVLNKSSDLILLYNNSKYDISNLVLNKIVKGTKQRALLEKRNARIAKAEALREKNNPIKEPENTEEEELEPEEDFYTNKTEEESSPAPEEEEKTAAQIKLEQRLAKREALKAKIKEQQEARAKMRDSLRQVALDKREARLKEIEDRKKELEKKANEEE